jgi:hypothetical protein
MNDVCALELLDSELDAWFGVAKKSCAQDKVDVATQAGGRQPPNGIGEDQVTRRTV